MASVDPELCPTCGAAKPADAPGGHCPRCLLRDGLDGASLSLSHPGELGATVDLDGSRVLETLAAAVGPVPRVLLRDTDPGAEPPVVRPPDPAVAGPSVRYRIDGEIARGGMGEVLKGHDPDLGRDVAVKVLRNDLRDRPEMVRRFVEEAQIGGQLQHPGIVPVYELGTFADRRPFFSMKLVKGQTLGALLAGRASPADGLPRLLGVFEQVAQTVAYAHARGVIHRDLKPSNVMVGSFGEVQVMDWGLAKVLPKGGVADDAAAGKVSDQETIIAMARSGGDSDVELSHAGSIIMGTPSYMAPEQARGEVEAVDERADVFALGSILAEALTGSPAFTGRSSGEIQRKAARADIAEALARLDACEAEAELVALARTCLAAEPADRPRDAGAVSRRVTAYLAGVQERLRAAELARVAAQGRARLTVAVAASVLVMAALGAGGWAWVRHDRASRALAIGREVDALLQAATMRWGQARSAPPGDLVPWREALAQARQAEALAAHGGDAATGARVRAVLGPLAHELDAAAEVESDIRIGVHMDRRGADAEFTAAFREAGIDIDAPSPVDAAARITARPSRAGLLNAVEAAAINRRLMEPPDRAGAGRFYAVLDAADPDPRGRRARAAILGGDVPALRDLAASSDLERSSTTNYGQVAQALIDFGDDFDTALPLMRRLVREHPDVFWLNWQLGDELRSRTPPLLDEAVRYHAIAVALRPRNGTALYALVWALADKGDAEEAIAWGRQAVRLQPGFVGCHRALAYALARAGQTTEAIATLRKALALFDNPRQQALCHWDLGKILGDARRSHEAITELKEAVRLMANLEGAYIDLGDNLESAGRLDEAIAAYRESLRISPRQIPAHRNLGQALRRRGDFAGSLEIYRTAHELYSQSPVWRTPTSQWLREAERLAALDRRLPAVLRGEDGPADAAEVLAFANICHLKGRHRESTRFWEASFAERPSLAEDMEARNRYNAACAAARAGSGRTPDEPSPGQPARAELRRKALGWLKADVAAYAGLLDARDLKAQAQVARALRHWRVDPDLSGVRDADALAALPEAERADWEALWAEADRLLRRAGEAH
jgi:serine/threonine-protein kinase